LIAFSTCSGVLRSSRPAPAPHNGQKY
jgi:hypothetical protein